MADVSVLPDMVEMPPHLVWAVVHAVPMPSRAMWEMLSALLVLVDLPFLEVRPRPRAQTLVFVGQMLS